MFSVISFWAPIWLSPMKGHHSVLHCPLHMYCRATQRQLFVRKSFCEKMLELVLIKFYTRNGSSLQNPIFLFLDAIFVVLTNFPAVNELKMEKMLSHIFIGSVLLCWCIVIHELHYSMTKQKITHVPYTEGNVGLGKNVKWLKMSIEVHIWAISFRKAQR